MKLVKPAGGRFHRLQFKSILALGSRDLCLDRARYRALKCASGCGFGHYKSHLHIEGLPFGIV